MRTAVLFFTVFVLMSATVARAEHTNKVVLLKVSNLVTNRVLIEAQFVEAMGYSVGVKILATSYTSLREVSTSNAWAAFCLHGESFQSITDVVLMNTWASLVETNNARLVSTNAFTAYYTSQSLELTPGPHE